MTESQEETPKVPRCWLFHATCPEGRIFEGEAIDAALEEGWTDDKAAAVKLSQSAAAERIAAAEDSLADQLIDANERVVAAEKELADERAKVTALQQELATEQKAHSVTKGQLTKAQNKLNAPPRRPARHRVAARASPRAHQAQPATHQRARSGSHVIGGR